MNKRLKLSLLALFVVSIFIHSSGCWNQTNTGPKLQDFKPGTLTIRGDGVEDQVSYTMDQLMEMAEATVEECYSTLNNVGTKKYYVGKGIKLSYLLQKAGIREDAQSIKIIGFDGYTAVFTRQQLEQKRYYYPRLMEGSEEEAREVPAILAWEYMEGEQDLSKARSGKLCLLLGQSTLNNVVVPAYVKDIVLIEISVAEAGQWDMVSANPASGMVDPGQDIVLSHPEMDSVKIYYTMDGSTPDEKSLIYNPGTSYYKPELNRPITIEQDVIIKAIAIGFGKENSPVAVYEYDVME
jgi:hypothetical protein